MQSAGFQEAMFTQRENYEEGPLRDRKRDLPFLGRVDTSQKAEFIKDVIALANSARFHGRPAYLLYGMDNDMNLCGVSESLRRYEESLWKQPGSQSWTEARFEEKLWGEKIGHSMIAESIAPYIDEQLANGCKLEYGVVHDQQCAYLRIEPLRTPRLLCSSKAINVKGKEELGSGRCWIRAGESKHELKRQGIAPDETPYCYSSHQVYHPFPSEWSRYFHKLTDIINEETLREGYQDLHATTEVQLEVQLKEVVKQFLETTDIQVLTIYGKAGMGKTEFLKKLVHELASAGAEEMDQYIQNEVFLPPTTRIPLRFSLRGWQAKDSLDMLLTNYLNKEARFWGERPETPEKMFDDLQLQWLVCFDGLDEIWSENGRREFLEALKDFQITHPRVKTILTTRPDITVPDLEGWQTIEIGTLKPEQIENYLATWIRTEQLEEITQFLNSNLDIRKLCTIPVFLSAAVTVFTDENIPATQEALEIAVAKPIDSGVHIDEPGMPGGDTIDPRKIIELSQEDSQELSQEDSQGRDISEQIADTEIEDTSAADVLPHEVSVISISKGQFLDRVYRYLWDREQSRRPGNPHELAEWFDKTGHLAALMDGQRPTMKQEEVRQFLNTKQGLDWVLSLGILERKPQSSSLCFVTNTTRTYFAASYILGLVREGEDLLEECISYIQRGTRTFWERALTIIHDLEYIDISPLESEVDKL